MFDELDVVRLTRPLPDENIPAGVEGIVVTVYGDHAGYEVEFTQGERTLALVTVLPDDLAVVWRATATPVQTH